MTSPSSPVDVDGTIEQDAGGIRARDAEATRHALLSAARRRFALSGYRTTTVRQIAQDAGVNVALISRYFVSKEGLFEACLSDAAETLDRPSDGTVADIVHGVTRRLDAPPSSETFLQLLLIVRTSGDEAADAMRRDALQRFTESMARVAGWHPEHPRSEELLLRAQIAISTALGMALLRSTTGVEPMTSATAEAMTGPLRDAFGALLR